MTSGGEVDPQGAFDDPTWGESLAGVRVSVLEERRLAPDTNEDELLGKAADELMF